MARSGIKGYHFLLTGATQALAGDRDKKRKGNTCT